ncbi:amino acid racemase [bacterium]|nr:amino acid racemase [bacterium]
MNYKRIGIVGGVAPPSTVLYYQQIIEGFQGRLGRDHYPELVIHSLDMGEINQYFNKEDHDALSDKLVQVIDGLSGAGCDFALFACNAMHMVFDRVRQRVQVPMVSLIQAVLEEVHLRQLKSVGLMGTTFVMQGGIYRNPLEESGIKCLLPDEEEQAWIMEVILRDLQLPDIPEETVTRLLKNVERLSEKGADGVILACTDLPVAITEEMSPTPLLDSTKIHVKATLDYALGEVQ